MIGQTIELTLNGEAKAFDAPANIDRLLHSLALDFRKVAIERNREIVPRSQYGRTWLETGDQLEIVHFIGGG